MSEIVKKQQEVNGAELVNKLVEKALIAKDAMMSLTQEQVDKIVYEMSKAGLDQHLELARMAIDETNKGIFEDKVIKNIYATEYIHNSIKDLKTVGIIEENNEDGYKLVAEPIGVVAGVTPVTNPTSTTMFKALVSVKGRNPIVFAFHPSAQKCSAEAARILRRYLVGIGNSHLQ